MHVKVLNPMAGLDTQTLKKTQSLKLFSAKANITFLHAVCLLRPIQQKTDDIVQFCAPEAHKAFMVSS